MVRRPWLTQQVSSLDAITSSLPDVYRTVLHDLVEHAVTDDDIIGVLLTGSLARGDALPGTDIDLRLILKPGERRSWRHDNYQGVDVERGYVDEETALSTLTSNPVWP